MESQLVSELKAELDASRRQNEHLCMKFGVYRKATQVRLSELRLHKRILGREVLALRKRLGASDGNETTAAAPDETSTREQTCAQNRDAREIHVQWASPIPDSEISAAIDSYDCGNSADLESYASEIAASVDSGDGGSTTPSATATVTYPIDSNHRRECAEDDQGHQQNDDFHQPQDNDDRNTNQGPSPDPFSPDPTPPPSALGGPSGATQRPPERSNPRSEPTSGRSCSNETVLRRRMLLLRHASRCAAPDGTCAYSKRCAAARRALEHITTDGCADPRCAVPHCLTSRYVLSRCRRRRGADDRGDEEGQPRKRARAAGDDGVCFPADDARS